MKFSNGLLLASSLLASELFAGAYQYRIEGNKRTQTAYIERLLDHCIALENTESPGQELSNEKLSQCLMNSKLFSEAKVERSGTSIQVKVVDVWTLIPIPLLAAGSDDSRTTGFVLSDSNFLGLGMEMIVGGGKSNRGEVYGLLIRDPSWFFSDWSYAVGTVRITQKAEFVEDGETIDAFYETIKGGMGEIGYRFNRVKVSASILAGTGNYDGADDFADFSDNKAVRLTSDVNYDGQDFRLYFSEGLSLGASSTHELKRADGEDHLRSYNASSNWQKAFWGEQALQLSASLGLVEGGTKADAIRVGGGPGTRGIEGGSVWSDHIYTGTVEYQFPIKTYEYGTLTVAPFGDVGLLTPVLGKDDRINYTAYGAGLYFYLKDIAIPGVGISVGYNARFLKTFANVALGFGI